MHFKQTEREKEKNVNASDMMCHLFTLFTNVRRWKNVTSACDGIKNAHVFEGLEFQTIEKGTETEKMMFKEETKLQPIPHTYRTLNPMKPLFALFLEAEWKRRRMTEHCKEYKCQ